MFNCFTPRIWLLILICTTFGCGGPDDGIYQGKIGNKQNVIIRVESDGTILLDGYWKETLSGKHERGSLQGEDMDALVFEGPAKKKFKLRILYQTEGDDMIIRTIQSRIFGPGARYVPTESDAVFSPPPRLNRQPQG